MKVHPAADIFPMLGEEELANLAADIKANGQLFPIILDAEGQLIDGRNRMEACKLAGVEPRFEKLNGHDPLAYIASANLQRRNLSKGQQAMALAKIYPYAEKGGRGKNVAARKIVETTGFSASRLTQARSVLAYSPALAAEVLKGVMSLDAALEKVNNEQTRANGDEARLERLRKLAPDLYDLVMEERMTSHEASAACAERESRRRDAYHSGVSSCDRLGDIVAHVSAIMGAEQSRNETDPPVPVTDEQIHTAEIAIKTLRTFYQRREAKS
jgi:hypothetical protein